MASRTAQCACGALKVTVEGEPIFVAACNCTQCQKRTGSVFGVSAYFPKEAVHVSGNSKLFSRGSDSGRKVHAHFCPDCGTTVFWDAELWPDRRGIAVGCFTDPAFPMPELVVYAQYRHHWTRFPENVPIYQALTAS